MRRLKWIYTYISVLRILPAYIVFKTCKFKEKCSQDLSQWIRFNPDLCGHLEYWQLGFFLLHHRELRNVFLNRLHRNPVLYVLVRICFKPLDSCFINLPPEKLGGGFYLQHGFSTIISAKEIGQRCRVYQQVTIGYHGVNAPVLGDDVRVTTGAIVIGDVHIGNGATVGAGAVVTHDVAEGDIVVGVPARPIAKV